MKRAVILEQLRRLQRENSSLRQRIAFFERHQTLHTGHRGEGVVSKNGVGMRMGHPSPHDIALRSGAKVEVKTSRLLYVTPDRPTKRWAWMKIYGHTNMKQFDYLVLLGDVDDRYRKSYADPQSPYVIFLVPEEEVGTFVQGNGTNLGIQLTTNPATVKERGRALFERFQVTEQQLDYRLRRAKQRRNRTARSWSGGRHYQMCVQFRSPVPSQYPVRPGTIDDFLQGVDPPRLDAPPPRSPPAYAPRGHAISTRPRDREPGLPPIVTLAGRRHPNIRPADWVFWVLLRRYWSRWA